MWEYAIREYARQWGVDEAQSATVFLEELNELGRNGWEAVGLTPRTHYDRGGGPPGPDTFSFVVLLKRRLIQEPASIEEALGLWANPPEPG
jgi:hypothetical protein